MQTFAPLETIVPQDPASFGWAPPVPPCGTFNMCVVEGRDLPKMDIGGTSDPFVVVTFTDQITGKEVSFKSNTVPKNLNPTWLYSCHSWVLHLPFTVKIHIYDEDLVSNDFMGYSEFTISTQDDLAFDAWVDLVARPGKKDKKVKGQIHIQWNVRFMKNFVVNPATEWPDFSLISIEPISWLNYIEIMGPIDDLVMLSCLGDCKIRRLPAKMFHKKNQKEALGWEIKVCSEGPHRGNYEYKYKWKTDYVQNICLRLLNRLANYGFVLLRGDLPHKSLHGDQFDSTLWLVRSRTSANVVNQSTYLMVEPWFLGTSKKVRVEIQGDLDPRLLAPLLQEFDFVQLLDPYKEHMMFSLFSKNYKSNQWSSGNYLRMKENASQNLVLAVMDVLAQNGFVHLTVWGGAHIMVRSNEWAATGVTAATGRIPSFTIVDPFWIPGSTARIEIQGVVDGNVVMQVGNDLDNGRVAKMELKAQKDKKGDVSSYQFKSSEIDTSAMTMEGMRKNENIFQNLTLEIASKLGKFGGYEYISSFGRDCLMLQRSVVRQNTMCEYLMVDPCVNASPLRFEIQGPITAEQAAMASASCGCDTVREEASSRFGHTAWVIPVAKTSNESWSVNDLRRKMNKLQFYGLRLLSYFHNTLGFEAMTQWEDDAFLCRRLSVVPTQKGQYIMVDTVMIGRVRVEVTGDISMDEVNAAALAAGVPPALPIVDKKDNNMVIGFVIQTDFHAVAAGQSIEDNRKNANLWQHVWIKFFNKLSSFGWQYKFPFNHGWDKGSVFFRPLPM